MLVEEAVDSTVVGPPAALPQWDALRCRGRGPAPSAGTGVRLSIETFTLVRKSHLCGIPGYRDRDDIDAVKVIFVPLRHEGRIAAVCGEECTGYGFDEPVLPGDDDNRVAIERLFESRSQPISIGDTEARIDGQPKKNRRAMRAIWQPQLMFLLIVASCRTASWFVTHLRYARCNSSLPTFTR